MENPRLPRKTSTDILDMRRRAETIRLFEHKLNASSVTKPRKLLPSPQYSFFHTLSLTFSNVKNALQCAINSVADPPRIRLLSFYRWFARETKEEASPLLFSFSIFYTPASPVTKISTSSFAAPAKLACKGVNTEIKFVIYQLELKQQSKFGAGRADTLLLPFIFMLERGNGF